MITAASLDALNATITQVFADTVRGAAEAPLDCRLEDCPVAVVLDVREQVLMAASAVVARLLRPTNARARINQLPPELLGVIFSHLPALQQNLWHAINGADFTSPLFPLALQRSGVVPLSLQLNLDLRPPTLPSRSWPAVEQRYLRLVAAHMHRIAALKVTMTGQGDPQVRTTRIALAEILHHAAPMLRGLELMGNAGEYIALLPDCLAASAPQLEELHLCGVQPPLDGLPALRVLVFECPPLKDEPHRCVSLTAFPNVEVYHVAHSAWPRVPAARPHPPTALELPRLRTLHVGRGADAMPLAHIASCGTVIVDAPGTDTALRLMADLGTRVDVLVSYRPHCHELVVGAVDEHGHVRVARDVACDTVDALLVGPLALRICRLAIDCSALARVGAGAEFPRLTHLHLVLACARSGRPAEPLPGALAAPALRVLRLSGKTALPRANAVHAEWSGGELRAFLAGRGAVRVLYDVPAPASALGRHWLLGAPVVDWVLAGLALLGREAAPADRVARPQALGLGLALWRPASTSAARGEAERPATSDPGWLVADLEGPS